MNKIFNIINDNKALYLFIGVVLLARPAYSIPTSIEELKQSLGTFCANNGFDFCAVKSDVQKKAKKTRKFTETEERILTRLTEQQDRLRLRSLELDRKEEQLKTLQEDIQRQVRQLEKIQQEIENEIAKKKNQDNAQLKKAVALYSKMDAGVAAQSLSKLERKIAVNILKQMKEKQASLILSNMGADESASMIEEITRKK